MFQFSILPSQSDEIRGAGESAKFPKNLNTKYSKSCFKLQNWYNWKLSKGYYQNSCYRLKRGVSESFQLILQFWKDKENRISKSIEKLQNCMILCLPKTRHSIPLHWASSILTNPVQINTLVWNWGETIRSSDLKW